MTDKEKLDKIIDMLQWKGYRFNKHDDIVDFMKGYINEAEDNKALVEGTAEELSCDGYEIERKAKRINADFDKIYQITRKYYNKVNKNVSDEAFDDFELILDISLKYV